MKQTTIEALTDANPNLRPHEDYSGRGMYGTTTCAVVGSLNEFVNAVALSAKYCDDSDWDDFLNDVSHFRTDTMGFDKIFY